MGPITLLQVLLLGILPFIPRVTAQYNVTTAANATLIQDALQTTNQTITWSPAQGSTSSAPVVPLTGQTNAFPRVPVSILYKLGAADQFMGTNSSTIAFISCDASDYPRTGSIGPISSYTMAVQNDAAAILLYSNAAPGCNVSGALPPYNRVWTMTTSMDSGRILNDDQSQLHNVIATIGPPMSDQLNYTAYPNLTMPSAVQQTTPQRGGGTLNTQVAMIILYTVTGIVTGLFLLIIVTGAIRAHRHPERYGPRRLILGRPRQTRAGGLARAMLDSLPIVKFGSSDENKDVEMTPATQHSESQETPSSPTTSPPEASGSHEHADTASVRSGIGPAEAPPPANSSRPISEMIPAENSTSAPTNPADADTLGCSICTEDFEAGQDMRVLPCDHRFHPACVDPWLLNVSGTCPLCRIELAPRSDSTAETSHSATSGGTDLPPPLEMGSGGAAADNRSGLRRSVFFSSLGIGPATQRDLGSRNGESDAVLEGLRRWRDTQRNRRNRASVGSVGSIGGEEGVAEENRRRRRFSRVFNIRTWREGAGEVNSPATVQEAFGESAPVAPVAVPEVDESSADTRRTTSDSHDTTAARHAAEDAPVRSANATEAPAAPDARAAADDTQHGHREDGGAGGAGTEHNEDRTRTT